MLRGVAEDGLAHYRRFADKPAAPVEISPTISLFCCYSYYHGALQVMPIRPPSRFDFSFGMHSDGDEIIVFMVLRRRHVASPTK